MQNNPPNITVYVPPAVQEWAYYYSNDGQPRRCFHVVDVVPEQDRVTYQEWGKLKPVHGKYSDWARMIAKGKLKPFNPKALEYLFTS